MRKTLSSLAAAWVALLAACSGLTDVTNTGIVQPEAENSAAGATAWYVGATRQFVGAVQTAIWHQALVSDEWIDSQVLNGTSFTYLDARRPLPSSTLQNAVSEFGTSSSALVGLRFAADFLRQYAPAPGSRIGQMYAYQGYLELYLAEQYCNGIPFSTVDLSGNVTYGGVTTTADTYARAIAHFDSAIAVSADSARVLNFALVGKARALLDVGRFADAATTVANVPTSFLYNLEINAAVSGLTNSLYSSSVSSKIYGTPAGADGTNGINWVATNDPRVRTTLVGRGADGVTTIYAVSTLTGLGSPVRIASGIEAQLIRAEAALQANNNDTSPTGTGWLGILNTLRASAISPALPALADPGSYAARVDLLFRERAFWLYLNGSRMSDMRRLVRQYGRSQDSAFPSGTYVRDGLPYGSEVTFAPPASESFNTNYTGCIDRKA